MEGSSVRVDMTNECDEYHRGENTDASDAGLRLYVLNSA